MSPQIKRAWLPRSDSSSLTISLPKFLSGPADIAHPRRCRRIEGEKKSVIHARGSKPLWQPDRSLEVQEGRQREKEGCEWWYVHPPLSTSRRPQINLFRPLIGLPFPPPFYIFATYSFFLSQIPFVLDFPRSSRSKMTYLLFCSVCSSSMSSKFKLLSLLLIFSYIIILLIIECHASLSTNAFLDNIQCVSDEWFFESFGFGRK